MPSPESDAAAVWRNGKIPVIYDRGRHEPLLVRVPYRPDNGHYLRGKRGRRLHWIAEYVCWEAPRSRFNDLVRLCLARWGAVYIIQEHRAIEVCAPACWNAKGYDCVCSCMGMNHGTGLELDHIVSEYFAFSWGPRRLACRLLRLRPETTSPIGGHVAHGQHNAL